MIFEHFNGINGRKLFIYFNEICSEQKTYIMSKSVLNLFALAIAVITNSCGEHVNKSPNVPLVKVEKVQINGKVENHDYPGIIKPQNEVAIAFKVNGQLKAILNKSGMEVKKGGTLALLDSHDYKVSLNAAEAAYAQSGKEFERIKQLYVSKTVSPNDYEKAEAAHQAMRSKYQAAKDAYRYTEVKAPFDGYIQNIYHQKGEIIQAGMPIMSFISKNSLKVELFLPFCDYEKISNLTKARLILNEKSVELKLESISHQANAAQLYKAEFFIGTDNLDNDIVAGKNCQVRLSFTSSTDDNTAHIPVSAITNVNNKSMVWVLSNQNIVNKVPVKIKSVNHDMANVTGLENGQQIVTSGIHSIKEGSKVRIMPKPSKTNIGGML